MVKANQKVVFDNQGSYTEDKVSGRRQYFKDKNGNYILEMWIEGESKDVASTEENNGCCRNGCSCGSKESPPGADCIGQEIHL